MIQNYFNFSSHQEIYNKNPHFADPMANKLIKDHPVI